MNSYKLRFGVWTFFALVVLTVFVAFLVKGFKLDTNVLDLLPHAKHDVALSKAVDKFSNIMGRQLIFLVSNSEQKVAKQAASYFVAGLVNSALLKDVSCRVSRGQQQAWGSFYFPYRMSLLTVTQRKLLKTNDIRKIEQDAIASLYSPMGIANSALLQNDPYLLFQNYIMALPKPASKVGLYDNMLMLHANNRWYVMITAELTQDSFSISNQSRVTGLISRVEKSVLKSFPSTNILKSGMLFYAKAGADTAQRDITTIGIGSLIGIILLILLTFRSLLPLILTLFSAGIGFMAAYVVTQLVFGQVYLFTLVFGASLIGISVDYAFFYYADRLLGGVNWNTRRGLRNILPGISLGLINIVLAYAVLSLTPFPGLRQLAVFAGVGLGGAFATVVCLFPLLLRARKVQFVSPLLRVSNLYLEVWKKIATKKLVIIFIILGVFVAIGVYKLKPNDDIHILEAMPKTLQQNSAKLRRLIGSNIGMDFFVVEGNTAQKVLENSKILTSRIDMRFPKVANRYLAVNPYLPTLTNQQENFKLSKEKLVTKNLLSYLSRVGVSKQSARLIYNRLNKIQFEPLTVQGWLSSPVSKSLRYLWLGKIENKYFTVVLLSDKLYGVNSIRLPFAHYINKADQVSHTLTLYRQRISVLLLVVYFVLLLLLLVRYGLKKALGYFLPPLGAGALSLAVLGWLGIPLTLFNVLGLILVLGIAVDYILFFAETRSSYNSTMLAVALSAIATVLSFGLLAFSATPVVHYFGVTVLVGIVSAFLLAPFVVRLSS